MTFSGITDCHETDKHSIIKFLIYRRIKQLKHKGDIEYNAGDGNIFDAVDWTTGIVYEPIKPFNINKIIEKTNRYILVSGVKDMIPVDIERYDLTETVQEWIDRVKEIVA